MPEFVRPSYLEELPPTQRLADYVPAAAVPAPVSETPSTCAAPRGSASGGNERGV